MHKFKVGDKVIRYRNLSGGTEYNKGTLPFIVKSVEVSYLSGDIWYSDETGYEHFEENLKLYEEPKACLPLYSDADAIKWLEQKGYKVAAPPKPDSGEIVVHFHQSTGISVTKKEIWVTLPTAYKKRRRILAIIPWTEGQGL